ncbi:ferredoxin [Mycobacterium sp. Root265]|uniref:ferredoxin n=1 Tax=Mycobacterium sp. Root265 TaxID=1736504 RepID=UPI0009EA0015|nr:ferredoxin [Mycobacterium sp. Root265]
MRVSVDAARCQGHTLCAMIAPESFELDDVDGHAHPIHDEVPEEHQAVVREAAQSCPEQAITVMIEHLSRARAAHGAPAEGER